MFTRKYIVRIYIYSFVQNKINVIRHHKSLLEGGDVLAAAGPRAQQVVRQGTPSARARRIPARAC